jgi:MFS family permease
MTILSGIQTLTMWLITSNTSVLVTFASLYGFCSGIFIAVLPVIVAQISPDNKLGGRIGAFYSVLAIAQLVGSPIAGALIKRERESGSAYSDLIVFTVCLQWTSCLWECEADSLFQGTTLVAGGVIMFVARYRHDRNLRKRL